MYGLKTSVRVFFDARCWRAFTGEEKASVIKTQMKSSHEHSGGGGDHDSGDKVRPKLYVPRRRVLLTDSELATVGRIVRSRRDMAQYIDHICSATCQPMSELMLANIGLVKTTPSQPADSGVYVCRYYNVHICKCRMGAATRQDATIQLIMPTKVGVIHNCPMQYEGSHMVCVISKTVLGINDSGVSYRGGGYLMSDIVAADASRLGQELPSLASANARTEVGYAEVMTATRQVFDKLFDYRVVGPPLLSLRENEIKRAVTKLRQENKSAYNNGSCPNLLVILETACIKYRNVLLDVPERPYANTQATAEFVMRIVRHCYSIKLLAEQLLADSATCSSKAGRGTEATRGRRRSNGRVEATAFALAIIYWMRTGYVFDGRVVIPRVQYVAEHWPHILVLPKLGLEKKAVTRISNGLLNYCQVVRNRGQLERLKFVNVEYVDRH